MHNSEKSEIFANNINCSAKAIWSVQEATELERRLKYLNATDLPHGQQFPTPVKMHRTVDTVSGSERSLHQAVDDLLTGVLNTEHPVLFIGF